MKKLLFLAPVILVLLVSGCTTYDPEQIVKDAVAGMAALNSYKASYDMTLSTTGMGLDFSLNGDMDIFKKGDKARADINMAALGQSAVTSTYQLPSGTYTCSETLGELTCTKTEDAEQSVMDPEESIALTEKMIAQGVVNLKFNKVDTLAGRSCYDITSELDVSKLGQLGSQDLEGIGLVQGMLDALDAFSRFDIVQCYDFETGMPLRISMVFEIDLSRLPEGSSLVTTGKGGMSLILEATSFEPNAVIEDSLLELPVEPLIDYCTDPDTGVFMTLTEARLIALASNCTEGADLVAGSGFCNDFTGTWWIDLDMEMEGCSPACVVDVFDQTAEINYRCTGLVPE